MAEITKNYTGAEIAAVCRSATSFALPKDFGTDPDKPSSAASGMTIDKKKQKSKGLVLTQVHNYDFMRALEENKPAFGMDNSGLENKIIGGIYDYG